MNKMHLFLLIIFLFFTNTYCHANVARKKQKKPLLVAPKKYILQKNSQRLSLTTSIIIPCHHKHACYLYNLIEDFEKQSILPQQIVISLSGAENISQGIIQKINNKLWPFEIKLIVSLKSNSGSRNRNIACDNATKDIIICQDADDLSHFQRIEIIKYFFETYKIEHLMHGMVDRIEDFQIYTDFEKIKWFNFSDPGKIFGSNLRIANGPVAFRKHVFQQAKYNESINLGEDLRFNGLVYSLYKDTIVILADIYLYNWALSTYPR